MTLTDSSSNTITSSSTVNVEVSGSETITVVTNPVGHTGFALTASSDNVHVASVEVSGESVVITAESNHVGDVANITISCDGKSTTFKVAIVAGS